MADYTLVNGAGTVVTEDETEREASTNLDVSTLTEAEEIQDNDYLILQRSTNTPQKVKKSELVNKAVLNYSYMY
jgi:hypothetical protein